MLDDLREQSDDAVFLDDDDLIGYEDDSSSGLAMFLGMTAMQRFIIAVMLLMMTCILSTFCLLVTERVYLPFF